MTRSTSTRRWPGDTCKRPGRLGAPWLLVYNAIPELFNSARISAPAEAPNISSGSTSGVIRLSSTGRPWILQSSAVANARSYRGSGHVRRTA
jgi:hypothetical protein